MDEEDDWSYRQFEYVSPEIASDKEIVLSLVSKRGRALEWAAEELKRDKDVAIAAVTNDGDALEDVYWEIRGDRDRVSGMPIEARAIYAQTLSLTAMN